TLSPHVATARRLAWVGSICTYGASPPGRRNAESSRTLDEWPANPRCEALRATASALVRLRRTRHCLGPNAPAPGNRLPRVWSGADRLGGQSGAWRPCDGHGLCG